MNSTNDGQFCLALTLLAVCIVCAAMKILCDENSPIWKSSVFIRSHFFNRVVKSFMKKDMIHIANKHHEDGRDVRHHLSFGLSMILFTLFRLFLIDTLSNLNS